MKKTDFFGLVLVILVISLSFLSFENNKVTGQTSDSSSSSGVTEVSSSSGATPTSTSSGELPPASAPTENIPTPSSPEEVPPTTSETPTQKINSNFSGIWKGEINRSNLPPVSSSGSVVSTVSQQTSDTPPTGTSDLPPPPPTTTSDLPPPTSSGPTQTPPKGSRIITLKLCVKDDGALDGVIHIGGTLENAAITSQTIISENEVTVNLKDRKERSATLTLKLTGDRQLEGTFADGKSFKARKLNPFRGCLAPGGGPLKGGQEEGPRGPKGPKGPKGPISSSSGEIAPSTFGEEENGDLQEPKGPRGPKGPGGRPSMGGPQGQEGPGMSQGPRGPKGLPTSSGEIAPATSGEEEIGDSQEPKGPRGPNGPKGPKGPEGPRGPQDTEGQPSMGTPGGNTSGGPGPSMSEGSRPPSGGEPNMGAPPSNTSGGQPPSMSEGPRPPSGGGEPNMVGGPPPNPPTMST